MGGSVKCLTRKCFLMKCAIRITIKKTANFIFQLMYPRHCRADQTPCHILIRQPLAANDCIHEMALHRVLWVQCHIITTLHHACAATFPNQALYRYSDPLAREQPFGHAKLRTAPPHQCQELECPYHVVQLLVSLYYIAFKKNLSTP